MTSDPFALDDDIPFEPLTRPAAPAFDPAYLKGLNPPQRAAVEAMDGPVLVLAGAGTGKTRVLTTRLAHIIATGRATPFEILAVTFTNKAAREMGERIGRNLDRPIEGMWLGTFHSIAARILRRHAEIVGLKPNFTILDTDDQIRLLKQLIAAEHLDEKRWPARALAGLIDKWKNRALTPEQVSAAEGGSFGDGLGVGLYRAYQERLLTLNACDFGDLLLHCITLFRKEPQLLDGYQRRFRYMLVDEYQDTNVAQYLWLRLLASGHKNICCVGDDDQSIYGWRGAEVGNILKFETDFPGAKIVRLEQNYRSTGHILGAAGGLIAENRGRLGKTLWTDAGDGEKVRVIGVWDEREEAENISDTIESLGRQGESLNECAILVRAGFQTRAFEERFIQIGLPYRVIGGPRFYERQEIRDAMAYLRVIASPDDDLAFQRIVNVPKRGLGDVAVQTVSNYGRARNWPMYRAAAELVTTDELKPAPRRSLGNLVNDFDRWRTAAQTESHTTLAAMVLEESGYTAMWQADKSPEAPGRLENLAELVRAMEGFENLHGFLEHVSLVMENEENTKGPKVTVMTMHAAKGLEFDNVFLPGWEEGTFPSQRSLDEAGTAALEEERRLAYVGLTRARRRATILFAGARMIFGQWNSCIPSRFIAELPEDHVEADGGRGLSRGRATSSWENKGGFYDAPAVTSREHYRPSPPTITTKSFSKPAPKKTLSDFAIGERVFHEKFGMGTVEDVDGDKLEIEFDRAGTKRVIDTFVKRAT